jgi:hypothetical protein
MWAAKLRPPPPNAALQGNRVFGTTGVREQRTSGNSNLDLLGMR